VTDYLNDTCPESWIGRCPFAWPPRSPDVSLPHYYFSSNMKTLVCGEDTNSRDMLLHTISDAVEQVRIRLDVLRRATDLLIHRA
jgi:hypothetical protein